MKPKGRSLRYRGRTLRLDYPSQSWDPSLPWDRFPGPSDHAIEAEIEREFFDDLTAKLAAGARERGAMLLPNECAILLDQIKKRHRPVDNREIGYHCRFLEFHGWKTEAAVAQTMKRFGVSRATVFSARKTWTTTESKS